MINIPSAQIFQLARWNNPLSSPCILFLGFSWCHSQLILGWCRGRRGKLCCSSLCPRTGDLLLGLLWWLHPQFEQLGNPPLLVIIRLNDGSNPVGFYVAGLHPIIIPFVVTSETNLTLTWRDKVSRIRCASNTIHRSIRSGLWPLQSGVQQLGTFCMKGP